MKLNGSTADYKVLILAPTRKDAEITAKILASEKISSVICHDLHQICREINNGADAAILTEEAIFADNTKMLENILRAQPPWSDFPLIVLTPAGRDIASLAKQLQAIGNMTLLNRQLNIATFLSHIKSALRDRYRQYDLRDYIEEEAEQKIALQKNEALANSARQAAEAANIAKSEFLANMSMKLERQ